MAIENQESYVKLEKWLVEIIESKINAAIVTFPGCGLTRRLDKFVELHSGMRIITQEGESLADFNILDLNFLGNVMALRIVEDYLKLAKPDQKVVVVLNDVSLLENEIYKISYVSAHVYDYFWDQVSSVKDTKLLVEVFTDLKLDVDMVFSQTGGISRLIKFLCLKKGQVSVDDLNLLSICRPMIEVINKATYPSLEKLGVVKNNQVRSDILKSIVLKSGGAIKIIVDKDLMLVENGTKTERVTRMERDLIKTMIENDNFLTREKVAEIKWGSADYSEFSDQAINKTMRRLSDKMNLYTIETIWKTGFKLKKRK